MNQALQAAASTPLPAEEQQQLESLTGRLGRDQLLWASGYLAGLAGPAGAPVVPQDAVETSTWHIFYATETGNSRRVAESLAERARDAGLAAELADLRDVKPKVLGRIEQALFVVATHGIGEAPDGSELFFEFWFGERAPGLAQLRYSVLALGDSSYADFCEIGQRLDQRLQALGATPLASRVDCDLDYDLPAAAWASSVVEAAADLSPRAPATRLRAVDSRPRVSREKPFDAAVQTVQRITGRDSSKAVHHIELDLEGSGLHYEPGDSLGVVARNPPPLVQLLLQATALNGDAGVTVDGQQKSLVDALTCDREITVLSRPLLVRLAKDYPEIEALIANRERLQQWFKTRQVIDLLSDYPLAWQAQELVDQLRRLTPRLYSIASGPSANPDEVHLTVAQVHYEAYGREHWGAASNFLLSGQDKVPVYVERNDHFRLPADGNVPVVMVGAGTGIAPYRAFMEQRQSDGHRGDNWLLFGDRNFSSDFLYQLEWLRYRKDGLLTRLDVAFSRDQADKVYVQHRLLENAAELWQWIERGAHIYVCGDADYMAADVQAALLQILSQQGGLSTDAASERLAELKTAGRYQRDVY